MRFPSWARTVRICNAALLAVGVACTHGSDGDSRPDTATAESPVLPPAPADTTYQQYVLVVLVGSWCNACRDPALPPAMAAIRTRVAAEVQESGGKLATIAVILDGDTESAYRNSHRYGTFDELILGGHWGGHGGVEYVWRDLAGPASIPQILLLKRQVVIGQSGYLVGQDELVNRWVGLQEISDGIRRPLRIRRIKSSEGTIDPSSPIGDVPN